jgi:MFS family permease
VVKNLHLNCESADRNLAVLNQLATEKPKLPFDVYRLTAVCFITIFGNGLVNPLMPLFAVSLGADLQGVGLAISAFGIALAAVNLPAALFTDRYGIRKTLIAGQLVVAGGALIAAGAPSFYQLLAGRVVQGVGSAIFFTAAMVWISKIVVIQHRGKANSIFWGLGRAGNAVGSAVGGFLGVIVGVRSVFLIFAGTALVAILIIALIRSKDSISREEEVRPDVELRTRHVLLDRSFLLLSFATFVYYLVTWGIIFALAPIHGYFDLNLDEPQVGLVIGAAAGAIVLLMIPLGTLSDRYGRRIGYQVSLLVGGMALFAMPLGTSLEYFLIVMTVFGACVAASGFATAWAADIIPLSKMGIGLGVYRVILDLGFALGPLLITGIAALTPSEGTFSAVPFYAAGVLMLTAALASSFVRDPARKSA